MNKISFLKSMVIALICYVVFFSTNAAYAAVSKPEVKTNNATSVGQTSVTLNGIITANGGANITDYGFYWGTNSNPTKKVSLGKSGRKNVPYTYKLTGLKANTSYYSKFYATNSAGTSFGKVIESRTEKASIPVQPLYNRTEAVNYAYEYYNKVCDDGKYYVNTNTKIGNFNDLQDYVKKQGKGWSLNGGTLTAPKGAKITKNMNACAFDCAHFVSGCFSKGKFPVSNNGAKNLKNTIIDKGYGFVATNINQLKPGDFAFNPNSGSTGHAMLITKVENGKVYVTHHSGANRLPVDGDKDAPYSFKNGYEYIHIVY